MKRILIAGAGGSPATNFVRSLRRMDEKVHLIGIDCDPYTLQRAETDVRVLVPRASDPQYMTIVNEIIEEEGVEFIHTQNDYELEFISAHREEIKARVFLPAQETVRICLDKFTGYSRWEKAGVPVPATMLITNEDDLKRAFETVGPDIWLRNIKGAAGAGAYPTSTYDEAVEWINFQKGWGHFTAATLLTANTVTWMSLWDKGKLVVAQGRKRLSWELGNRAPSGVTGVTGTGLTFGDKKLDDIALSAIYAIDPEPDGIFSVDCTYAKDGVPNVTEINIGRFFTTHLFFTAAGLNMPEMYVRLAYGEPLPAIPRTFNPLPNDLAWIRGVDFEPVLKPLSTIQAAEEQLASRRKRLAS